MSTYLYCSGKSCVYVCICIIQYSFKHFIEMEIQNTKFKLCMKDEGMFMLISNNANNSIRTT